MNWEFMRNWFGDYAGLLAGGYAVTLVITIGLFLFCCSKKFHRLIFRLLDIVNQKFHGRFEIMEAEIKRQCMMLEDASKHLLKIKSNHRRDLSLSVEMLFLVWNPVSSF